MNNDIDILDAQTWGPGAHDRFRWLLEEFRVSLFAQELGTSLPISPRRIDRFLEENRLISVG